MGKRGSGVQGLTLEQRLWRLSSKNGFCWEWNGYRNDAGYGVITVDGHAQFVHRVAWELFEGPIPEGLTIDHLCENPSCWKTAHLEPVSMRTNILRGKSVPAQNARKTHCVNGHPLEGENIHVARGRRYCRTCRRDSVRASRARNKRANAQVAKVNHKS